MCKLLGFLLLAAFCSKLAAAAQNTSPVGTNTVVVPAGAVVPPWSPPAPFKPEPGAPAVYSKDLELVHAINPLGGFVVRVAGHPVALGASLSCIGYVAAGQLRWVDCSREPAQKGSVKLEDGGLVVSYEFPDKDGGTWRITRRFRTESAAGGIEIQTDVSVSEDRAIAFLPMLLVFPGAGSFGNSKNQGLFAGLEYLENEPSSSEADVIGPAAKRQVPDSLKITFPLSVIQADDRFIALTWQMRPFLSALFDSPDRLFNSGGHVMGLLFPGSEGKNREEGNLLPKTAELVRAGASVISRAEILGGPGTSVVPAIQQFCRLRHPPPIPSAPDLSSYVSQAAGGWLDSKIRNGNLVRHALANSGFNPQPAADAGLWVEWLADQSSDPPRRAALREAVTNLLSAVPPEDLNSAGVGHIRYPVESLVFGHVAENADHAARAGQALLASFQADGSVRYHANPGGTDYGKTHFTNEASGFTSRVVADLLQNAAFSGDRPLIDTALQHLKAMDCFDNGVPRGAQTWECPLHTPDILGSANMVHAYTLGYELTGDRHFLDEARYWAWTGLPFVYLVNPTEKPVGLYSTIAVYGATQWRAPVWFGLPVQWCGLVYADALYRLGRYDPQAIWKQIAKGITVSGMQQSWPQEDTQFQGLLPDSFRLREQHRNGPAINPATVEACAAQYFRDAPVYDFHCFRANHLLVHAPGEIKESKESKDLVSFQVQTWVDHSYFVLINGLTAQPEVKIDGQTPGDSSWLEFHQKEGRLILRLEGNRSVRLVL